MEFSGNNASAVRLIMIGFEYNRSADIRKITIREMKIILENHPK
jgi:hypothetical protein